jgi:molybdopterin converting factor small subunit
MSPLLTQYAISQLQTSKEAKENNAASAKQFMESNTQLRKEIQIIMQTLESKQQILDATRASTADKELQVKRLRDEALLSRKQLEELALKEKEQLQHDLEDLQAEFTKVRANSERSMNIMQNQIQQILDSRDELVSEADQLGLAIAGTHKLFAEKTTSQTKQLRNEMSLYLTQSEHIDRNVVGCRDEVNGLIIRVRNYANSNSAT